MLNNSLFQFTLFYISLKMSIHTHMCHLMYYKFLMQIEVFTSLLCKVYKSIIAQYVTPSNLDRCIHITFSEFNLYKISNFSSLSTTYLVCFHNEPGATCMRLTHNNYMHTSARPWLSKQLAPFLHCFGFQLYVSGTYINERITSTLMCM